MSHLHEKGIHRQILALSLPSILSNITVPLLSLADTTIVGHLGEERHIAAIAVGTTIFNMVYWLFAFLRMGTTGLTGQAHGAGKADDELCVLMRSLLVGGVLSLLLCALQTPLLHTALWVMEPDASVAEEASRYFRICIWGAPAVLAQWSVTGWFIGRQDTLSPMCVAITQNVVNVLASLILAIWCHWGMEGVAWGTTIAQYTGIVMAAALAIPQVRTLWQNAPLHWVSVWDVQALGRFFRLNADIMLRTLCIIAVTVYFTTAGAQQGETILAANALLMQYFILFSYFMDGLANAGEALSAKYCGSGERKTLSSVTKALFVHGAALALCFCLLYALGGEAFLGVLTDQAMVKETAANYMTWVIAIPLMSAAAFVWDGIFIGLTMSRGMLVSMAMAACLFFVLWFVLSPSMGNKALWLAFDAYLAMRSAVQTVIYLSKKVKA